MTRKLLLADDSVTIQRVIELTFADQDVQVLTVGDGEQAIARIPVDQPDIVLADIGMPKRSGYDVSAFVKGNPELRHIPVLLLAGAFEPVDEARAEQVGCNGVLVKPFEPQHVIARVRELLGGATGGPALAAPDMPRPVERLSGARTIEFPRKEEPEPVPEPAAAPEPEQVPQPEAVVEPPPSAFPDADLGAVPEEPAPALEDPFAAAPVPEFKEGESLDEYFARLGAALEAPASSAAQDAPAEIMRFDEPVDVPTLDEILGTDFSTPPAPAIDLPLHSLSVDPVLDPSPVTPPSIEPPDSPQTLAPQPAEPVAPSRNIVADAFTALLAVEQGEPGAMPVRLASAPQEPVVTEAFVDELAERIITRLAPGSVRDVVAQVVSEVAERLVREEIERIRSRQ